MDMGAYGEGWMLLLLLLPLLRRWATIPSALKAAGRTSSMYLVALPLQS